MLSMDTMLANETDALERIVQHFGLDLSLIEDDLRLPRINVAPHKDDVTHLDELNSALCAELKSLYQPHLQRLYSLLGGPGMSPWQPPFPPFDDPCPSLSSEAGGWKGELRKERERGREEWRKEPGGRDGGGKGERRGRETRRGRGDVGGEKGKEGTRMRDSSAATRPTAAARHHPRTEYVPGTSTRRLLGHVLHRLDHVP